MSAIPLPHEYVCQASARPEGVVTLVSSGLPDLDTAPPAEFGGPGDQWSPETLLTGAIADCFILTFRAIARISKLEWSNLECRVEAKLDRKNLDEKSKVTRFTEIKVVATLDVPAETNTEAAERILHKAEKGCLVTNSLLAETRLETEVRVEAVA